ncbi:hypothetical protein DXG01_014184, partial [Tephrocybe rancida]
PPSETAEPDRSSTSTSKKKKKDCRPAPIQGVTIPNLKPGTESWKNALEQWEHGEPARGLNIPLKDWPHAWYKGAMRTFTGTKRRERELVSIAYHKAGGTDKAFTDVYPQARISIRSLLEVLRSDPEISKRRKSKNGTPEE